MIYIVKIYCVTFCMCLGHLVIIATGTQGSLSLSRSPLSLSLSLWVCLSFCVKLKGYGYFKVEWLPCKGSKYLE